MSASIAGSGSKHVEDAPGTTGSKDKDRLLHREGTPDCIVTEDKRLEEARIR